MGAGFQGTPDMGIIFASFDVTDGLSMMKSPLFRPSDPFKNRKITTIVIWTIYLSVYS